MAKNDNLSDYLLDIANAIREKKGTSEPINAQNFADEIRAFVIGGGDIVYENGVYVQHIDKKLYTSDEWTAKGFSNDQANGVAVVADEAKFVIAKDNVSTSMKWLQDISTTVDGVFTTNDLTTAKTDFSGQQNTALIVATDTDSAAYSCANYTFPNGEKGYLPALGEWVVAYQNKNAISAMVTLIGGTAIANNDYWSSTQHSASNAWTLSWNDGNTYGYRKSNPIYVRAFTTL